MGKNKFNIGILLTIGLVIISLLLVACQNTNPQPQSASNAQYNALGVSVAEDAAYSRALTPNSNGDVVTKNTMTVGGSFTSDVESDQVEIYLRVKTENEDGQQAQEENAEVANEIIQALKNAGLTDDEIETTGYNVQLIREWEYGKYVDKGIRVINSIKVTTKDLEKTGKILDAAFSIETSEDTLVEVNSVQFSLSKEKQRELNEELLGRAAENAKDKADSIADALDISIVRVLSVSEGSIYIPTPYYYDYGVDTAAEGVSALRAETPISPSSVSASASVSVVFEIS